MQREGTGTIRTALHPRHEHTGHPESGAIQEFFGGLDASPHSTGTKQAYTGNLKICCTIREYHKTGARPGQSTWYLYIDAVNSLSGETRALYHPYTETFTTRTKDRGSGCLGGGQQTFFFSTKNLLTKRHASIYSCII